LVEFPATDAIENLKRKESILSEIEAGIMENICKNPEIDFDDARAPFQNMLCQLTEEEAIDTIKYFAHLTLMAHKVSAIVKNQDWKTSLASCFQQGKDKILVSNMIQSLSGSVHFKQK
jgi:hypothetical protein